MVTPASVYFRKQFISVAVSSKEKPLGRDKLQQIYTETHMQSSSRRQLLQHSVIDDVRDCAKSPPSKETSLKAQALRMNNPIIIDKHEE